MNLPSPLKIVFENCSQFELAPTPVRLTSHQKTPEVRNTQAIDLAVKAAPLTVPPMSIQKPSAQTTQHDLELKASRPSEDTLIDENGGVYHLHPVIINGGFGAVRIAVKDDPVIPRRFMFKEMALSLKKPLCNNGVRRNQNTVNLKPFDEKKLRREIDLMLKVDSPLAPQLVLKTEDRVFLAMPPQQGDLFDAIAYIRSQHPHLLPILARTIMADVGGMLVRLDKENISHRDIKPENMLYTQDGHILLADYGLSEEKTRVKGLEGTYAYVAPEAYASVRANFSKTKVQCKPYDGKKADIWALGITTLQALVPSQQDPFDLTCYYDQTLNMKALRREYSGLGMHDVDLLGILDSSLQSIHINMSDFEYVANVWREFIAEGSKGALPITGAPDFDAHLQSAWKKDPALLSLLLDILQLNPSARPSPAFIVEAMQHKRLCVTPAQQRELAAALLQRPHSKHQDSGSTSPTSSDSQASSRIVTRNNTAV